MDTLTSLFAVIAGFVLRMAIPILGTGILIYFLRKLDSHWQTEAQLPQLHVHKTECWKIKNCSPEEQKNCIAAASHLPCWQVFRLPNGYLREECISCKVFTDAPIPTLQIELGECKP